jgi:peptidyl-prolyl cis-trans isomerase C
MRRAVRGWLALLWLPCAAALAQGIYPGDAVRVNGEAISYQRFHGFYVEYRNSKGVAVGARGDQLDLLTRLREEAMDLLVEQALVGQAAEAAGIEVGDDEVEAEIAGLRAVFDSDEAFRLRLKDEGFDEETFPLHVRRVLAAGRYLDDIREGAAPVTDAELERFYRDNERRLTYPEEVRVRHILLTWKPLGTGDDRAAIREQMRPILERARNGEDFAALARDFSNDAATRGQGGDTGFFHRGEMTPAFEEAAFGLAPGQVSDPVETPFGVHILRVEERRDAYLLPYDEVRERLREYLRRERAEAAIAAEIDRLRAAADVQILIPLASRN